MDWGRLYEAGEYMSEVDDFCCKKMKTSPICTHFSPFAAILLKLINSSYIVFDYVLVTV